jgi:hypothetical protein
VFEPGMVGQLTVMGNEIFVTVSDGTAPFGLLDDIRVSAFQRAQIDEISVIQIPTVSDGYGNLVATMQVEKSLEFSNIIRSSFTTSVPGTILNEVNGTLIIPIGTPANFDSDGDSIPDSVRSILSYRYHVPNIPGDDSTIGSGRATVWIDRGIFETDQFDTTQPYPLNALLYVGPDGRLTTKQPKPTTPGIAIVTGPPTSLVSTLEFLWF